MEENQNYGTIYPLGTGNDACPYINNTLIAGGALLTNYYGCGHDSEDNYDSLFFGNAENGYADPCPNVVGSVPNLADSLLSNGYTFCGYAEGLPSAGSTICSNSSTYYNIHHCPWAQSYTSVGGNLPVTCGQPFTSFPTNYANLPTISWVIPNQNHNMHDGTPAAADTWLQSNMASYATWCQTSANNSILIVTWDEDGTSSTEGDGTTVGNYSDNHIVAVIYGAMVTSGKYPESGPRNHYNLLSTLLGMYSLNQFGYAEGASTITDVF